MLAGLSQLTALGAVRLAVALKGVAGFTGSGQVRFVETSTWRRRVDAELSGLAGLKAELVLNGAAFCTLDCNDGAARGRFDSAEGVGIPALCEGDIVEVRQNGVAVLKGDLKRLGRGAAGAPATMPLPRAGNRWSIFQSSGSR